MRLINAETLDLHEFVDAEHAPPYAILSHCWGKDELSFKDFRKKRNCSGSGYQKILDFCAFAKTIPHQQEDWDSRATSSSSDPDGIRWAWIDPVCIDKRNSAELSEAINSMYRYYSLAQICLARLSDVSMAKDPEIDEFLVDYIEAQVAGNREWEVIGTKNRLVVDADRLKGLGPLTELVASITGVPKEVLKGVSKAQLARYSVAGRMSWAANRQTTRIEDLAYCLLGLFDINMPLLYGEGRDAFRRLQEEIVSQGDSDSILAWRPSGYMHIDHLGGSDVLARSAAAFADSGNIVDAGGSLGSNLSRDGSGWALRQPMLF